MKISLSPEEIKIIIENHSPSVTKILDFGNWIECLSASFLIDGFYDSFKKSTKKKILDDPKKSFEAYLKFFNKNIWGLNREDCLICKQRFVCSCILIL
jgi:hypothetical protein